jgi:putative Mg2+ transporter-C (MgtC) family protein
METSALQSLLPHWTGAGGVTEGAVVLHMLVALVLGIVFGYERFYHGRAAGMRTYGLVCMVAAGLTAVSCSPGLWFGGQLAGLGPIDPTRTVQGIVTGIGFLGAGIIMQDGLRISGLTTAASIWAAAAIGILAGLGLYAAAVTLTFLSMGFMMWGAWATSMLPTRQPVSVTLVFRKGFIPNKETVQQFTLDHGYEIAGGTLAINHHNGQAEWGFVAIALGKDRAVGLADLAQKLPLLQGIENFQLARARN